MATEITTVEATLEVARHRGIGFQLRHNHRLIIAALLQSLVFFTFGYDGSVTGGLLAMPAFIKQFADKSPMPALTATQISLISALPSAGALLGFPIAAYGGDRWGRKNTLFVACVISLVAAVLQTAASELAMLIVGRFIANTSIFIFIVMGAAWLAEISPADIRGHIVGLSIVVIDLAAVIVAVVNHATSSKTTSFAYRLPLGLQLIFPVLIALGLLFVRDSPTFYLIKNQEDEAMKSLKRIRQGYTEVEIEAEMTALKAQSALVQEENELPWNELFKGTNLRRTLLALSVGNFQQLSGIAFATNYATIFLEQIDPSQNPFVLSIGLAILALGGACVGLLLVDRVGRRTLALVTFTAVLIIDTIIGGLGFVNTEQHPKVASVIAAFCLMFSFFFAAGFGPLTYIVSGEMPTARLRNKTNTFAFFVLICFSVTVVYVLPYISQPNAGNLGAKTYLIFAAWMLMVVIVIYFYFPETKGRSPAELDEMFEARLPAHKFKSYVCVNAIENFVPEVIKHKVDNKEIEYTT